jgi:hypothetical protein
MGESRVSLVELLLDLMQDALFVFGERHLMTPVVIDAPSPKESRTGT